MSSLRGHLRRGSAATGASSTYAELLEQTRFPITRTATVYDRIWRSGRLLLQLHAWDAEDHPNLVNADAAPPDTASSCGSRSTISTAAVERARRLRPQIIEEPALQPGARSIARFGSATPTAMWWWSPVRTAKGPPDRRRPHTKVDKETVG